MHSAKSSGSYKVPGTRYQQTLHSLWQLPFTAQYVFHWPAINADTRSLEESKSTRPSRAYVKTVTLNL
jgi:hypothetical protein